MGRYVIPRMQIVSLWSALCAPHRALFPIVWELGPGHHRAERRLDF
jgi:hypothetical protein